MRTGYLQGQSLMFDAARLPSWLRRLGTAFALVLVGCSNPQLYAAGQAWQRNECQRIQNAEERNRCMQSTARSYDEYQKDAAAVKGTK